MSGGPDLVKREEPDVFAGLSEEDRAAFNEALKEYVEAGGTIGDFLNDVREALAARKQGAQAS